MFDLWVVYGVAAALAEVAEFVEGDSVEVAALGAFAELPQVSLNSWSDCSSRSNSSWSGTPCGA